MVRWVHLLRMCCQVWSHDSQASLVRPQGHLPEGAVALLSLPASAFLRKKPWTCQGPALATPPWPVHAGGGGARLRREPRGRACEDEPDVGLCRAALGL